MIHSKQETGRAVALITPDSERTFATFLGAAIELSAEDLSNEMYRGYDYFHIEGYLVQNHELIEKAMHLAKENGLLISLDLASYNVVESNLDFLHDIIRKYVDILFANEEEAKSYTGFNPVNALHELGKNVDIAIVKTGNKGSLIKQNNEIVEVGIIQVDPVDTTGAGDLYASGFLYGHANGLSLRRCGELGTLLAGNVIEFIGAKMSRERWKIIKEQL
jgi:sugar/nucleoside kinase (ribokinase family)